MKRFLIILALALVVSCASTQHVVHTDIVEIDEVAYVLENYYPELFYYYMEGVLQVKSIRENVLANGTVDYDINYEFVRYYYRTYREQMDVLKEYYPELYRRYWNGTIHINSIYKYVDRQSGTIEYSVSYSNHYDTHYGVEVETRCFRPHQDLNREDRRLDPDQSQDLKMAQECVLTIHLEQSRVIGPIISRGYSQIITNPECSRIIISRGNHNRITSPGYSKTISQDLNSRQHHAQTAIHQQEAPRAMVAIGKDKVAVEEDKN